MLIITLQSFCFVLIVSLKLTDCYAEILDSVLVLRYSDHKAHELASIFDVWFVHHDISMYGVQTNSTSNQILIWLYFALACSSACVSL